MKREDFKEIREEHIETCKKIINREVVSCNECPFVIFNSTNNKHCFENNYWNEISLHPEDERLLNSAKEFLEKFKDEFPQKRDKTEVKPKYTTTNPILNEKLRNGDKEVEKLIEKTFEVFKDNVNSPNHYKLDGLNIESIEIIKSITGNNFKWFCLGNIIKYILRAEKKNGLEDYKKASKYLSWLIENEEK